MFSLNVKIEIVQSKRIVNPFLFETRVFCSSVEEVFVRFSQIYKRSFRTSLAHFTSERKISSLDSIELLFEFQIIWLFAVLILFLPLRQPPVIHKTSNTTGFLQKDLLFFVRIYAYFVRNYHLLALPCITIRAVFV